MMHSQSLKVLIRISSIRIIRIFWIIRIFVFIWKASWYSNKYKQSKCTDLLLSVYPVWPISTNSIIFAIKSVSWSGYSFAGLTSDNPTKLINSSHIYGTHAPGITSHWKYPGAFLNECSVWSFWGCLFLMRFRWGLFLSSNHENKKILWGCPKKFLNSRVFGQKSRG